MKRLFVMVLMLALAAGTAFAGSNDQTYTNNQNYNYNKDVAMAQTIAGFLTGAFALSKAPSGGDVAYKGQGYGGGVAQPDDYRDNSRGAGRGYGNYYDRGGQYNGRGNYPNRQGFYTESTYPQYQGYQGICQNYPVRDGYGRVIRVDTYCK